jgi:two-component system, response regulator
LSRSRIILLVEDNPDDVDLALRAFTRSGVENQVVIARDGKAALDHLFPEGAGVSPERKRMPELVLLDLKLPKVDGLAVLRRLRAEERTRRIPVVVLTSSNEERDIARSYDFGANSFVRKPVNFEEFAEVARQISQYWLVLNEP